MLKAIQRFFQEYLAVEQQAAPDVEHALQLATAALLIEMSRQDDQVHPEERSAIATAVQRKFGLDPQETAALVRLAEEEAQGATDYFQFTSLINEHFSPERKVRVIEHLWEVAFADGHLDRYEEHMVRKIAELLYVSHTDFIAAKHRVVEKR